MLSERPCAESKDLWNTSRVMSFAAQSQRTFETQVVLCHLLRTILVCIHCLWNFHQKNWGRRSIKILVFLKETSQPSTDGIWIDAEHRRTKSTRSFAKLSLFVGHISRQKLLESRFYFWGHFQRAESKNAEAACLKWRSIYKLTNNSKSQLPPFVWTYFSIAVVGSACRRDLLRLPWFIGMNLATV